MEDTKKIELVAKTAASWWATKVWNTKFDNGATDQLNVMASMMASMSAVKAQSQITVEKQMNFEKLLTEAIMEKLNNGATSLPIGCDYNPDHILAEAADKAGIPSNVFPWKTKMLISDKRIQVSEGYGEPYYDLSLLKE